MIWLAVLIFFRADVFIIIYLFIFVVCFKCFDCFILVYDILFVSFIGIYSRKYRWKMKYIII